MSIDCPRPVRRPNPSHFMEHHQRCLTTPCTASSTSLTTSSGSPSRTHPTPEPARRDRLLVRLRLRSRTTSPTTPASAGPPGSTSTRSAAAREPRPDWVVTSQGAIDTELGILKTGKEADVFLAGAGRPAATPMGGRRDGGQALPRHRPPQLPPGRVLHRGPQHEAVPRRARAQAQEHVGQASSRPASGRSRSGTRSSGCWALGLPVPYPVQIDGTEILMEWITVDGETAPRLAQTRPDRALLESYFDQLRDALATMVQNGHRPRRPLGVQHPGRGRPAGDHRPAADRRPGRQPERDGLPDARLRQRLRLVPRPRARGRRARAVRRADGARVLTHVASPLVGPDAGHTGPGRRGRARWTTSTGGWPPAPRRSTGWRLTSLDLTRRTRRWPAATSPGRRSWAARSRRAWTRASASAARSCCRRCARSR